MHPRALRLPRFHLGLALASLFMAAGCVSYDERGVLHADGTGEVRIAIGVDRDYGDPQDVAEVKRKVARLAGVRWLRTVDSNAGSRRWQGAVLAFDSVEALRPLNRIIELEDLFVGIDRIETDSGIVLRRNIRLPAGSERDGDFTRISWRFPGDIVQTDRRAKIDSTGSTANWRLPMGDESEPQARMLVRYKEPILATPAWLETSSTKGWFEFPRLRAWWNSPGVRAWTDALPFRSWLEAVPGKGTNSPGWWLIALQVAALVVTGILAVSVGRTRKRLLQRLREKSREASGFLPSRSTGRDKERSRRR